MKRLEIIGNRSIEEDLFDMIKKSGIKSHYTKIPVVFGEGNSAPKMGDGIWPEENFIIIVYCENDTAEKYLEIIREIKKLFPDEGIKVFEVNVDCCV